MKKIIPILAMCFIFTLSIYIVNTYTYNNVHYVDADCATPGDGTSDTCAAAGTDPFQTVAAAQAALTGDQSDNSLLFKRGNVWREQFTVGANGTSGHPFTIGAYGSGDKPIINGADVISGSWSIQTVGSEVYTAANALANSANEANATTGITNSGMATFESTTKGDEPDGSYSLHLIANSDGDSAYTNGITVVSGVTYQIRYYYIVTNGDVNTKVSFTIRTNTYTGAVLYSSGDVIDASWTEVTNSFTATSNTVVFRLTEQGSGNDVETYITGLSIKPSETWRKDIGSTEPNYIIFNGNQIGTSNSPPSSDYEYEYSDPNLDVYATSNPDSYYTSINATQRKCIDFNSKSYITIDGIHAKYGQQYALDAAGSNHITLQNMTIDDVEIISNGYGLSIDTCTFDRVGTGYPGAFVFLNNGCQNFSSLNSTYTDGNGIQINACSTFSIVDDTFDGETKSGVLDDQVCLKAIGGDTEDGTISGINLSNTTSIVSIGSAVGVGHKIEDIDIDDCHITSDGWTLLFIKPGVVGGASGGGTINNISMSNSDMTTLVSNEDGGSLLWIDTDAGDDTTITNISQTLCTVSSRTNAGVGSSAFVKIKQATGDEGETLNGVTITSCQATDPGSGGGQGMDYGIDIDGDTSLSNILIQKSGFFGTSSMTAITDEGSTFTDILKLYNDNFKSFGTFSTSIEATTNIEIFASIINGDLFINGGNAWDLFNNTVYGGLSVDSSNPTINQINTIVQNEGSIGSEEGTTGNCTDPTASDADNTTGWTNSGLATFESTSTNPYLGAYALHCIADSDGDRAYLLVSNSLEIGKVYVHQFYYKAASGKTIKFRLGTTNNGNQYADVGFLVSTSWIIQSVKFVAESNNLYLSVAEGSGSDDAEYWVDAVSLKPSTQEDVVINEGSTIIGINNLISDSSVGGEGAYTDTATLWSTDPLFTNAAGGDFSLKNNSPACRGGTYIAGYTTKWKWGQTDPANLITVEDALSIGAYACPKGSALLGF